MICPSGRPCRTGSPSCYGLRLPHLCNLDPYHETITRETARVDPNVAYNWPPQEGCSAYSERWSCMAQLHFCSRGRGIAGIIEPKTDCRGCPVKA